MAEETKKSPFDENTDVEETKEESDDSLKSIYIVPTEDIPEGQEVNPVSINGMIYENFKAGFVYNDVPENIVALLRHATKEYGITSEYADGLPVGEFSVRKAV